MPVKPIAPKESYQLKEDEIYMNKPQKQHFEKMLLDWKAAILAHNKETMHRLQSDNSPLADLNDRASLEEELSLTLRSRDRERKLISKIDAALERLVADEFGYCQGCHVEIGIARLEARPTAELCIDCKELEEKREVNVKEHR